MRYNIVTYFNFCGETIKSIWARRLAQKFANVKKKEFEKLTGYVFRLERIKDEK